MTPEDFSEILARERELRNVEFKAGGPRTSKFLLGKVLRAMLGMANHQDGGRVIIGVEEVNKALTPSGISEEHAKTWTHDDLAAILGNYADPAIEFDVTRFQHNDRLFVELRVYEFEDIPVLCKKEYVYEEKQVIRAGGCYVRNRHKSATSEIPSQAEMRDLLDLATRKALRRFVQQAQEAGLSLSSPHLTSDDDRFREQINAMWEESRK